MNNYTPGDVDRLLSQTPDGRSQLEGVEYLIFGREVGASGTPHLQGTVCFTSRKRLQQVISVIGQAHCSTTRSLPQSIEYCKKDGDFSAVGLPPMDHYKSGERSDLESFKEDVKNGTTTMKELRELHSEVCARYPRFVKEYVEDMKEQARVPAHPLRDWQEALNGRLILPPDPREIIFVIDLAGNKGKSWFARHYCDLHDNAQIIVPGKKADMTYVMDESCRVFFLDCPRSKQGDFIQYDFLEELKNGYVFSPKYESRIKKLDPPHVVVLMNERPDMTKLSVDRYSITVLN